MKPTTYIAEKKVKAIICFSN